MIQGGGGSDIASIRLGVLRCLLPNSLTGRIDVERNVSRGFDERGV